MQNKAFKGLFIMLGIIFVALQQGTPIWPVAVITAFLAGAGYYTKNYLIKYTSDSIQGQISVRDVISTIVLAIIAGLSDSISQFIVNDTVNFTQAIKIVGGVVMTYFTTTFFEGQKTK